MKTVFCPFFSFSDSSRHQSCEPSTSPGDTPGNLLKVTSLWHQLHLQASQLLATGSHGSRRGPSTSWLFQAPFQGGRLVHYHKIAWRSLAGGLFIRNLALLFIGSWWCTEYKQTWVISDSYIFRINKQRWQILNLDTSTCAHDTTFIKLNPLLTKV